MTLNYHSEKKTLTNTCGAYTKDALLEAHAALSPLIYKTPVIKSLELNDLLNAELYFKCENFQQTGSFKIRGATNALLTLKASDKPISVVTHSSGNFAQALACAAGKLNIKAHIVMPKNAPLVKKNGVKKHDAILIECEPTLQARETAAKLIIQNTKASFIHPSNQKEVIIGNSTIAKELLDDNPNLEYIIAPVGGGGLIAGTALSAFYFGLNCQVIGAEPEVVNDAFRSLKSGKIEINASTNTIADGLKTHLGNVNFPIIKIYVKHIILVTETEIINAMHLLWQHLKILIEPSSAVAFAVLFKEKNRFKNKKIGIILSGGNVELSNLPFIEKK